MKNARSSIEHFDRFATEYDIKNFSCGWHSPRIMFGLAYDFIKPGGKLLDIGIGTGQSSINFWKFGLEIYGIDGSQKMLRECEKKGFVRDLQAVDLNCGKFPYEDKMFESVISCGVFHFFKDLSPFFNESNRVLKDGGAFSFTTEDLEDGGIENCVNRDNDKISLGIVDNATVKLFRHSTDYIHSLAKENNFGLRGQSKYLAYHSSVEKKDVWFKNYLFIRSS